MRLIDYIKIIHHSFFSRNLYKYAYHNWQGNILFYYLILFFFLVSLFFGFFIFQVNTLNLSVIKNGNSSDELNNYIHKVIKQLPEFRIESGVLKTDNARNYEIFDEKGNLIVKIDPSIVSENITRDITKIDEMPFFQFTKDKLVIRILNFGIINPSYYELFGENYVLNKDVIIVKLERLKASFIYSGIYLIPLLTLIYTSFSFVNVGFITVLILFISKIFRYNYDFQGLLRVLAIADTPSIIVTYFILLANFNGIQLSIVPFLVPLITAFYVVFSIRSINLNTDQRS